MPRRAGTQPTERRVRCVDDLRAARMNTAGRSGRAQRRGCQVEARLAVQGMLQRHGFRRTNSFMIRSSGLLVRIFCQWMSGKA